MTAQSPLVGKTLEELDSAQQRPAPASSPSSATAKFSREMLRPTAKTELMADDILLVDLFAPGADVDALRQQFALEEMPLSGAYFTDRSQEIGMAEVIVPATSDSSGKPWSRPNSAPASG